MHCVGILPQVLVDLKMIRVLLDHTFLGVIEVTSLKLHLWGRECAKDFYTITRLVILPMFGVLRLVGGGDAEDPSYIVWV